MTLRPLAAACALSLALTVTPALSQTKQAEPMATPGDLLEPFNRAMFGFNNGVVDTVVDPLAGLLSRTMPEPIKQVGANLYENISEPEFVFTNLLAGYPKDAAVSVGRFMVNSTVGLAGMFDVATPIGLERRTTEVSEAMCRVGIPPGPYLVLPLIGPTNVFSGGLLAGALAAEWYALSLVSAALAAGDAIFDLSVSVASLRHVRDLPSDQADPYARQQREFWDYVKAGCATQPAAIKTAAVTPHA